MKPNSPLLYVHCQSNHPPSILKNIPESVNNRLSELSSTEEIFKQASKPYQEALNKSGYTYKLKFSPIKHKESVWKRGRKIIWFIPPYSKNVDSDIGKQFFKLIEKNFPKDNILNPIINKNSVKLSYSCLPNMGSAISRHNAKILRGGRNDPPPCECQPEECPVEEKCKSSGVVYQATLRYQGDKIDKYVGLTERPFISRYEEHEKNFENRNPKNSTTLSKKIWNLQDRV